MLASQQQIKRTKKNGKKDSISKQKEQQQQQQQPNIYDLSKQIESHTKQLSRIESIIQQLSKFLKNADTKSRIIKQINFPMNKLQRQIGQIQKSMQIKKRKVNKRNNSNNNNFLPLIGFTYKCILILLK